MQPLWPRDLVPMGYDRVRAHTAPVVNERIDERSAGRLARVEREGEGALRGRVAALDREWDIDRALMVTFATLGGASLAGALLKDRRFAGLLGLQLGFLLLHAFNGWCPPVSLFRRLGLRTRQEIEAERYALLGRLRRGELVEGAVMPT